MTEIFGILNPTPDSFSDGGSYKTPEEAIEAAEKMFADGASYIDVGGESTRPGADAVPEDEEWRRLEPILSVLIRDHPGRISVDTYKPGIVRRAANIGDIIINDVTGFNNMAMIDVAVETGFRCILSHLTKKFKQDIQAAHNDADKVDSIDQVRDETIDRRCMMIERGVGHNKITVDPGIGFNKTRALNWRLLEFAREVPSLEVMIGASCKSFLGVSNKDVEPNLNASRIAIVSGAKYLRLHPFLIPSHIELIKELHAA